jgi:hypothetical protein
LYDVTQPEPWQFLHLPSPPHALQAITVTSFQSFVSISVKAKEFFFPVSGFRPFRFTICRERGEFQFKGHHFFFRDVPYAESPQECGPPALHDGSCAGYLGQEVTGMRTVLSVSLPDQMAAELEALAKATGRNKSDAVKVVFDTNCGAFPSPVTVGVSR